MRREAGGLAIRVTSDELFFGTAALPHRPLPTDCERLCDGALVHDGAASNVDEDGARAAVHEPPGTRTSRAQEASCLWCRGQHVDNIVTVGQEISKRVTSRACVLWEEKR